MGTSRLRLTRRGFLRALAGGAGLATLTRVPAGFALAADRASGLQVLDASQAELVTQIVERMCFSGDPSMPSVRDTEAVLVIDQALLQVDDEVREQLAWLLWGFDWLPPVLTFDFSRFRNLAPERQDAYIRSWAASRFTLRRIAFQALKNLAMLGYYTQDATWAGIGYGGPWAPRPRRRLRADALPGYGAQ